MTGAGPGAPGFPISVAIATIRAEPAWWLEAARRLDAADYAGVWAWDHFMGRGARDVPVVEAWTILGAAAAATERARLGTYVANVMNHHPAVVARMASNLQVVSGGRFVLGIGVGGHPAEHHALGIPFPEVGERSARLEEAIAVIRALWTGGPVSRRSPFYPLDEAWALPRPEPAPPIIVGGRSPAAARMAARIADGWTAFTPVFEERLPVYLEALADADRRREDQQVLVGVEGETVEATGVALRPWLADPRGEWERWRAAGADGVVLTARSEDQVRALLDARGRW